MALLIEYRCIEHNFVQYKIIFYAMCDKIIYGKLLISYKLN